MSEQLEHAVEETDLITPSLCTLTKGPVKFVELNSTEHKDKKTRGFNKQQLKDQKKNGDVDNWVAYIKGNGSKPKSATPTLISSSRPERAANKPLVVGTVEGVESKVFFDTGAEINVLDYSFFKVLKSFNPRLKVEPTNTTIRCANDTRMKALGKVTLNINLQGAWTRQTFTIVQGIFPKVIVGIRQMKQSGISVDPLNDCIWFKNRSIPFVSKVILPMDQENSQQLVRRV
jgi:hypothetical protein